MLNEVRVGYTHLYTFAWPQGFGTNHTALAGIRGFEQTSPEYFGFPEITVTGFGTLIATLPFRPATAPLEMRQVADSLTWTKAKHTFKFGYDYRRHHYSEYNGGGQTRGSFNNGGAYGGHAEMAGVSERQDR